MFDIKPMLLNKLSKFNNHAGQTLIIVLLVMVVSLAVGLSVSSRATSTLRQTTNTYQSAQALAFAEAGLEEALGVTNLGSWLGDHTINVDGVGGNDVTYNVSPAGSSGSLELILERDLTQHVDLTGATGNVSVYWRKTSEDEAALEITFLYLDNGAYKIKKYALDPNATRRGTNNFSSPSGGDATYQHSYSFAQAGTPTAVRLRSLYNASPVSAKAACTGMPGQGYRIVSSGTKGSALRKVESVVTDPAAPSAFDYVLFSGGNLQK